MLVQDQCSAGAGAGGGVDLNKPLPPDRNREAALKFGLKKRTLRTTRVDCQSLDGAPQTHFKMRPFDPAPGNHQSPRSRWSTDGRPVTAVQTGRRSGSSQENVCSALEKATSANNWSGARAALQAN